MRPSAVFPWLLLGSLAGCVLFVSPPDLGDHCQLGAHDDPCGACVQSQCTAALDTCCAEGCNGLVDTVESCAKDHGTACTTLLQVTGDGPRGALGGCVASSCASLCQPLQGTSRTRCRTESLSEGLACSCQLANPGNDATCSSSVFPRTRCCAPEGWPGAGQECTCKAVSCVPTSDGCACVLASTVTAETPQECTGLHCCAGTDVCACRVRPCDAFEREVPACALAEVGCDPGRHEVASCSVRSE